MSNEITVGDAEPTTETAAEQSNMSVTDFINRRLGQAEEKALANAEAGRSTQVVCQHLRAAFALWLTTPPAWPLSVALLSFLSLLHYPPARMHFARMLLWGYASVLSPT